MTRRNSAVAFLVAGLLSSSAWLFAQQQAAEAPASARTFYSRPAVAALHGVVTSGHPIASSAGLQMLLKGGNAFDAAVAVGAMAALGEPEMNGIGGNGFMTVFDKTTGKVLVGVDGRRGAESARAGGDDARDPERRHESRHRARQPRRLSVDPRALRHDERSPRCSRRRSSMPSRAIRSTRCWRSRSRAARTTSASIRPRAKIFLPNGEPLEGRRAAEESRLRRHAAQARRGRTAGAGQGRDALAGDSTPPSIASTRATSRRSSSGSSRRTAAS